MVVDTEVMVMEGVATLTGVEGGDLAYKPRNYSKVKGNSWMQSDIGKEILRFDWIEPVRMYHEQEENRRRWNDYFKNTGLSAEDIVYPYHSGYYGQTSYLPSLGDSINFVSKNLMRLYR